MFMLKVQQKSLTRFTKTDPTGKPDIAAQKLQDTLIRSRANSWMERTRQRTPYKVAQLFAMHIEC